MVNTAVAEKSVCTRIADRLSDSIGTRRYSMWFDRSVRLHYNDQHDQLEVAVPNQFVADWVGKNFKDALHDAALAELGKSVGLRLRVEADLFGSGDADHSDRPKHAAIRVTPEKRPTTLGREVPSPLRHRLDDFVVGPSNELAFSAANRLVLDEEAAVNPLFIHGGCGLGKTHLLQGICQRMLAVNPKTRVLYTTGEHFTNEFLAAMRANKIDRFRKKIRRLDLLAVDDVHFLANKQATQQEFLHSFDAIELGGARLVLASDSHPSIIKQFSEALVSRCVRGMVVQVHQPNKDMREQIIRKLSARRRLSLQDNAAQLLAGRCSGSVRDIEGMMTRLHALAMLSTKQDSQRGDQTDGRRGDNSAQVGHALIEKLFQTDYGRHRKEAVRWETILNTVAQQLCIDRKQVLGSTRHQRAVFARSLAVYLGRQMTMMSYPEIATAMGRRTHSTMVTACQRVEKQVAENRSVLVPADSQPVPIVELIERLKHAIYRA